MESAPILVSKGMPDLLIGSAMVPRKGTDEYAIGRLAAEILGVGSTEVMVRSGQEPSIIALKEAAASRVRPDGVKVIPEESAVADSRGNGFAESTVKEENLARTLLSSLNAQCEHTFGGADVVVVWLVRYYGQMLNRFRRGPDGKTAYERRKGRAFQRKVPPLGEKILYQLPGITSRSHGPARVEPRREDGVYFGLSDRADVVYIGKSDGSVARARAPKRREATARHDLPFLQRLTARAWDPPRFGGPGD